jgi:hypothetical protein
MNYIIYHALVNTSDFQGQGFLKFEPLRSILLSSVMGKIEKTEIGERSSPISVFSFSPRSKIGAGPGSLPQIWIWDDGQNHSKRYIR